MTERRVSFLGAAIVLAVFGAVPARAEYEPRECSGLFRDQMTNVAFAKADAALDTCLRNFMGVTPIETRAAQGERVYRAFIARDERSLPLFVEFVHKANGSSQLDLRTTEETRPRYVKGIAESSWLAIEQRWAAQPQLSARAQATEASSRKVQGGIETVCIMPWRATLEIARTGTIARIEMDACDTPDFQFIDFLLDQAAKDAGACADGSGRADERIERCLFRRAAHR